MPNDELMVSSGTEHGPALSTMGVIVAASPRGEGNLAKIQKAFGSVGLAHLAPEMRSLKEALRAALVEKFVKKNRRVAPCGAGYEVVEETPIVGTMRNDHRHIVSVALENGQVVTDTDTFFFDGGAYTSADIHQWVSDARERIDGHILSGAIADVCSALRGVSIRDAGGAYWLPESGIQRFAALREALDAAGKPVSLVMMDMASTARSVQSTIARVEAMAASLCAELDSAVHDGEMGERALATQADRASLLIEQIAEYECVLSTALPSLTAKVSAAKKDVIQAGLDAHARKERKRAESRFAAAQAEVESLALALDGDMI